MYEQQTYKAIKQRMLANIKGLNVNEGSITNDLQSAKALELANTYFELDNIINLFFLKNNSYEMLDNKADEWGIKRKEGTKATGQVTFAGANGVSVDNGTVLEMDALRFVLLNDVVIGQDDSIGYLEATENGGIFNVPVNSTFALTTAISGVTSISNTVAFEGGSNEETDEELVKRFTEYKQKIRTSGNKNDYKYWTMEVKNVGDCKVYDSTELGLVNTVKVVIVDNVKTGADATLVNEVKAHIETVRPVGVNVQVVSATEKAINISAKITLANGYTLDQVKTEIQNNITKYLYDNAFTTSYVSTARLGNVVLDSDGVFDYTNFTVNGGTANIPLTDIEVAALGTVVLS